MMLRVSAAAVSVVLAALGLMQRVSGQAYSPGQTALKFRSQFKTEDFVFNLAAAKAGDAGKGGELRVAAVAAMPSLAGNGVSQALYRLYPCGMNSVQMHPRATELFYVINATELHVGFVEENGGRTIENVLKTGQLSFVPKGLLHWHYNAGCEDAIFLSTFNHEDPGVLTIVNALFDINSTSLQAAFNVDADQIADIKSSIPASPVPGIAECLAKCGQEAVDPCELKKCGENEVCKTVEGKAQCECKSRHVRDENGDCVSDGGFGSG